MNRPAETAPGFHGKLVTKGDFVTRRLPRSFLDPWDAWLQDVIGGSRARMGEAWLDAYLTSPIWRFVLSAGLCGDAVAAGVVMPSVDRVGRYFPLSLVASLPDCGAPIDLPIAGAEWFGAAESLVRSALDDGFDFDRFDEQVAALGVPASSMVTAGAMMSSSALRLPLAADQTVADAYRKIAGNFLADAYPRCSLWWTAGSQDIEPIFLVCKGLPTPESFGAFLDGRWDEWGWAGATSSARLMAQA